LGIWGFDTQIFQASAPGFGPQAGESITEEIKEALYCAKLVILIFTLHDYDWAYCMWECGLATHPKNSDTKTIVFQCNPHDTPKTFEGQLLVKIDQDGVKNFTIQFHRDHNFFPGEEAYRPDITDETIDNLTGNFYRELSEVIPPGHREERKRWDFLSLQLTKTEVEEIVNQGQDMAHDPILKKCKIVDHFGNALKHFGYVDTQPDLTLAGLVKRWTERTRDRPNVSHDWIKELGSEIFRAVENSPASPEWKTLSSVTFEGSWFHPVVNHALLLPDGSMQFDVYFYKSLVPKPKLVIETHSSPTPERVR
jgi:hypothetical protein